MSAVSRKELLRRGNGDTELHGRVLFVRIRGGSDGHGVLLHTFRMRRRVLQIGIFPRGHINGVLLRVT